MKKIAVAVKAKDNIKFTINAFDEVALNNFNHEELNDELRQLIQGDRLNSVIHTVEDEASLFTNAKYQEPDVEYIFLLAQDEWWFADLAAAKRFRLLENYCVAIVEERKIKEILKIADGDRQVLIKALDRIYE